MSKFEVSSRLGFTLIELLVVLLTVPLVLGVVVPAVQKGKDAEARQQTANNLAQCGKGAHNAHDQFKKYPPYYGLYGGITTTFHVHVLPFIEHGKLYNTVKTNGVGSEAANAALAKAIVLSYLTPQDFTQINDGMRSASLVVNISLFNNPGNVAGAGNLKQTVYPKMPASFPDGTSNTILFATHYTVCGSTKDTANTSTYFDNPGLGVLDGTNLPAKTFGTGAYLTSGEAWQQAPKQAACTLGFAQSFQPQAIHVCLCDASVRTVSSKVSTETWKQALTPAGGEKMNDDWKN